MPNIIQVLMGQIALNMSQNWLKTTESNTLTDYSLLIQPQPNQLGVLSGHK